MKGSQYSQHSHRPQRLADDIRSRLGEIISQMADRRVGFATVTEVILSPDLRHARVYVSVLGPEEAQRQGLQALAGAHNYLRRELASQLALRYTPELAFELDRGFEQTQRVEELLRRAKRRTPNSGGAAP